MAAGSVTISILASTGSFETDIDRAAKSLDKVSRGVDKQIESLSRQAAALGRTATQTKLYELALDGANASQLREAALLRTRIDAYEKTEAALKKAGAAAKFLGVALVAAAGAAVIGFQSLVKGAGEFADLSDGTGASAEGLASLAVAAAVAGVSMDTVASSITKLAKNLTGVDVESKAAGQALKGLGINVADLKKLDQVSQLEAISKAFNQYEDGAAKSAYATAIFRGDGEKLLRFFKELGAQGRTTILSEEQIQLADEYSDKQARATATLKLYAQAAATEALPALTAFTGGLTDVIKALLNVDATTGKVGANTGIRDFAESASLGFAKVVDFSATTVKAIVFLAQTIKELADEALTFAKITSALNPAQIAFKFSKLENPFAEVKDILAERGKQFGKYKQDLDKFLNTNTTQFQDAVQKRVDAARSGASAPVVPPGKKLPTLPNAKIGGATDDPTKKLLDNALKDLERQAKDEQELLQARNHFLDLYNSQNLISISDYYAARRTIEDQASSAQVAIYDKELEALRAFQATAKKETDKAAAQGKIEALQDKRGDAIQKAGLVGLDLSIRQKQAEDELAKAYAGVNAQVLELQGRLGAAAAIKFDQGNDALSKRFTAEGNQAALQALQTLRANTIAQADFTKASTEASQAQEQLRIQEDRVALAAQTGAIGQLEALKQVGDARKAAIAQQEAIVATQEAIARASATALNPAGDPKLVLDAQKARLALDQLKAALDPLADKFDSIFKGGFTDAISSFLDGTKSAKNAFKDFADSIAKQIIRIASQDLVTSLYGSRQEGTGLVGVVGNLFGGQSTAGKGQATQAAASPISKIASLFGIKTAPTGADTTAQTTATVSATTALDALAAAASGAATALGGSAGTGAASGLGGVGGLFDNIGFGEASGGSLGSITTASANAGAPTSAFGFGTSAAGSIDFSGFGAALGKSTEAAGSQAVSLLGSSAASDAQAGAMTAGADAGSTLASTIGSTLLSAISTAATALVAFATSSTASSAGEYAGLLSSFDVGTNYVSHDQVAMIHKGEAIVPARFNTAVPAGSSRPFNPTLSPLAAAAREHIAVVHALASPAGSPVFAPHVVVSAPPSPTVVMAAAVPQNRVARETITGQPDQRAAGGSAAPPSEAVRVRNALYALPALAAVVQASESSRAAAGPSALPGRMAVDAVSLVAEAIVAAAPAGTADVPAMARIRATSESLTTIMRAASSSRAQVAAAQTARRPDEDDEAFARRVRIPMLATGTNLVERDMIAMLHKGESVVPKEYNPAAGGTAAAMQGREQGAPIQHTTIVHQNFTVQGTPNRATQTQIAAAAAQGLRSGQRNL